MGEGGQDHEQARREGAEGEGFCAGDKVEGNYFTEGKFQPGVMVGVGERGDWAVGRYDNDGLTEMQSKENVRSLAYLLDEEALGTPSHRLLVRESRTGILDVDLRKELPSNVVLVDGGSLFLS